MKDLKSMEFTKTREDAMEEAEKYMVSIIENFLQAVIRTDNGNRVHWKCGSDNYDVAP